MQRVSFLLAARCRGKALFDARQQAYQGHWGNQRSFPLPVHVIEEAQQDYGTNERKNFLMRWEREISMIAVQVVTTTKIDDKAFDAFLSDCGATLNSYGEYVVCDNGCVLFSLYRDVREIYNQWEEEELQARFDAPVAAVLNLLFTARSGNLVYMIAKKFIDQFGGLYDNGSEVVNLDDYLTRLGIAV